MGFEVPEAAITAAIERLIAEFLTPEEIDRRIDALLESRIGTLTLEQIADRWQLEPIPTRRMLRKWKVKMCVLSTKTPRWRVATIQQVEKDREITPKSRSRQAFTLVAA